MSKIKSLQNSQDETKTLNVTLVAIANLPTKFGQFRIAAFENNQDGKEHVAVIRGEVKEKTNVLTRIHSECMTGDVFGSRKCDCGEQLNYAMEALAQEDSGILLYMRQEGRGIGLNNKIRAYQLQDQGMDTVEANLHLGFDDDIREYDIAAEMIRLLEPKSLQLMTNNPRKFKGLLAAGIEVSKQLPIKMMANPFNEKYLETKKTKSGHLL